MIKIIELEGNNMLKIIGNRWENHELMLMLSTIASLITFKKIKNLNVAKIN